MKRFFNIFFFATGFVCLFIAAIFFCAALPGCDGGNVITSVSNDVQAVKHFTQGRGVVIQTVEHEGHKYIVAVGKSGVAILHDPACEATNRKQGSVGSPVGAAAPTE